MVYYYVSLLPDEKWEQYGKGMKNTEKVQKNIKDIRVRKSSLILRDKMNSDRSELFHTVLKNASF